MSFTGKARLITLELAPSLAYAYGEPNKDFGLREAMIQAFSSLGKTSTGFIDVKLYGSLDGDEYGPNAERLIAIGRKP